MGTRSDPATTRSRTSTTRFRWSDELAELLGTIPDKELAQKAGVTLKTVAAE